MRVISQTREDDIPYENTTIRITQGNDNDWIIRGRFPDGAYGMLASYPTREDCRRVLSALWAAYQQGQSTYFMPQVDE